MPYFDRPDETQSVSLPARREDNMGSEKLGTCDGTNSPWIHRGLHRKSTICVNWREQPAPGEPSTVPAHIGNDEYLQWVRGGNSGYPYKGSTHEGVPSTLEAGEKPLPQTSPFPEVAQKTAWETASGGIGGYCPGCEDCNPASPLSGMTAREFAHAWITENIPLQFDEIPAGGTTQLTQEQLEQLLEACAESFAEQKVRDRKNFDRLRVERLEKKVAKLRQERDALTPIKSDEVKSK